MSNEPLWRWSALAEAVGLPPVAGPAVSGISIDSRTLQRGDLFIALKGDPGPRFNTGHRSTRDGHDFIAAAVERGAAGVLVDRPVSAAVPTLQVSDTLDALWALGAAARRRFAGCVIAVTGSSGKTTAKTFLSAALGCPASLGSLNNFWGVPLSLARTPAQADAAVFEIGTNHPGEIEPLARLVAPNVALVLNVGLAHIEHFPDPDALRREKLSLGAGLEGGGALVVPDDLDLTGVGDDVRIVRFGFGADADVQIVAEQVPPWRLVRYRIAGRDLDGRVPGGGRHRASTLAAVLACLSAAGRPVEAGLCLDDDLVPAGRGRRHAVARHVVIDDSYNANPASMAAALVALNAEPGRRLAILGEMLELGDASAAAHRGLAEVCSGLDGVWCVGEGMRALYDALPKEKRLGFAVRAEDLDDAALESLASTPGTLLVKGSNRVFWVKDFVARLLDHLSRHGGKP